MSFAEKIKADQSDLLWLVKGKSGNKKAWWFIQLTKSKLPLFSKALKSDKLVLTEFGSIVTSGFGEKPAHFVFQALKDKGLNPDESLFE